MKPKYKKVLLKLSGEAFMGKKDYGIDQKIVQYISKEIEDVSSSGVHLAVVIGGGNIFRGLEASAEGIERTTADYMGMLATVLNASLLNRILEGGR
jgi:uridylate kinase